MSCELCGGRGWRVRLDSGNGTAAPCECRTTRSIEERLQAAGVPSADVLDLQARPWQGAWRPELDQFPDKRHMLTLGGPEGRGKTRLAIELLVKALEAGKAVRYRLVEDLLSAVKDAFDDPTGPEPLIRREIEFSGVLCLDEAWTQQATDFNDTVLSRIIRRRFSDLRPTITITNLSEAQVRQVEPRLASRFTDCERSMFLEPDGPDFRRRKA